MSDETRSRYLESGSGEVSGESERLDLIRDVLGDEATWAEPPRRVADEVMAAVALQRPTTPPVEARSGGSRWAMVVGGIGAAAAVVTLVLASVSVIRSQPAETLVPMAGTELEPGASGEASVRPTGSGWWIRLDLEDLPPAPEGSYYEGWVWSDEGEGVSIGTFHLRDGPEPVIMWSGVAMSEYPSIWVTLEPEDEGPEASGEVVMKGRMPDSGDA